MKKKNRGIKRVLISFGILLVLGGMLGGGFLVYKKLNKPWYEKYPLIAHAMGGINEQNYTNSLEAFQNGYANGHRVFEIDLLETSDGVLVGRHKWKANKLDGYSKDNIPSAEVFLSNTVYGAYTPLSFLDVLKLASEHPDIYIVTDTKKEEPEDAERVFSNMAKTAEDAKLSKVLKKQFIIQIYNMPMYALAQKWIDPDNLLYTLYKTKDEEIQDAVDFCVANEIPVMTINAKRWTPEIKAMFQKAGIVPAVHTINKKKELNFFISEGCKSLYTDFLIPADISQK